MERAPQHLNGASWRAHDLWRAYAARDRAAVKRFFFVREALGEMASPVEQGSRVTAPRFPGRQVFAVVGVVVPDPHEGLQALGDPWRRFRLVRGGQSGEGLGKREDGYSRPPGIFDDGEDLGSADVCLRTRCLFLETSA
ncbi:hypothetical protein [Streptomyces sp. NPDC014676]|uniref:hypothetical protein n=1 Tax=Streptomyces sp. NPDC014676 TaxID=3364879 RepID=UPI0036F84EA4